VRFDSHNTLRNSLQYDEIYSLKLTGRIMTRGFIVLKAAAEVNRRARIDDLNNMVNCLMV
jgi:hypothetical protein